MFSLLEASFQFAFFWTRRKPLTCAALRVLFPGFLMRVLNNLLPFASLSLMRPLVTASRSPPPLAGFCLGCREASHVFCL